MEIKRKLKRLTLACGQVVHKWLIRCKESLLNKGGFSIFVFNYLILRVKKRWKNTKQVILGIWGLNKYTLKK